MPPSPASQRLLNFELNTMIRVTFEYSPFPLYFRPTKKIPEGLVVAIPEMEVLIEEIDALYVQHAGPNAEANTLSREEVQDRLTDWSSALLASLPPFIQEEVRFS